MKIASILVLANHAGVDEPLMWRARQLASLHSARLEAAVVPRDDVRGAPLREASRADLLVLGDERSQGLDALAARAARPVLLSASASPYRAYGRILAVVGEAASAGVVLQAAAGMDGDAEIEVYQAATPSHPWPGPVETWEARWAAQLSGRRVAFTDSTESRRTRVLAQTRRGGMERQAAIRQEACGADLVIMQDVPVAGLACATYGGADLLLLPPLVAVRSAHLAWQRLQLEFPTRTQPARLFS